MSTEPSLRRILNARLCPKAALSNISEFTPMREAFILARESKWNTQQLAGTFIILRGIRGRAGVQVALKYLRDKRGGAPHWGDRAYLQAFVNHFEEAWADAVRDTRMASALSHQEHQHAGLSGMNFIETLLSQSTQLFGSGGLAERLSPYFTSPGAAFNADVLLAFYNELVAAPMMLRLANSNVKKRASRLLGKMHKCGAGRASKTPPRVSDGSYNSMDFLRCYSNIMCAVYGAPEPSFTMELWTKMIQCQARPAETRALLKSFDMDMQGANAIIASVEELNWTTFLVCVCEVRQAMGRTEASRAKFRSLVQQVELTPGLLGVIRGLTAALVTEGATSKHCYCVRLCNALRDALPTPAESANGAARTPTVLSFAGSSAQVDTGADRIHMLLKKDFAPAITDGRKAWEGRPFTREARKLHLIKRKCDELKYRYAAYRASQLSSAKMEAELAGPQPDNEPPGVKVTRSEGHMASKGQQHRVPAHVAYHSTSATIFLNDAEVDDTNEAPANRQISWERLGDMGHQALRYLAGQAPRQLVSSAAVRMEAHVKRRPSSSWGLASMKRCRKLELRWTNSADCDGATPAQQQACWQRDDSDGGRCEAEASVDPSRADSTQLLADTRREDIRHGAFIKPTAISRARKQLPTARRLGAGYVREQGKLHFAAVRHIVLSALANCRWLHQGNLGCISDYIAHIVAASFATPQKFGRTPPGYKFLTHAFPHPNDMARERTQMARDIVAALPNAQHQIFGIMVWRFHNTSAAYDVFKPLLIQFSLDEDVDALRASMRAAYALRPKEPSYLFSQDGLRGGGKSWRSCVLDNLCSWWSVAQHLGNCCHDAEMTPSKWHAVFLDQMFKHAKCYGEYWCKFLYGDIGNHIEGARADLAHYTLIGPGCFDLLESWGVRLRGPRLARQQQGLEVVNELRMCIAVVYHSGMHLGLRRARAEGGLQELTAYDTQVQCCEHKRARRATLHSRLASTRSTLLG